MMKSYREWANENLSVFTGIKPKYIPKKTMSEFKYGDMVEVRDYVTDKWEGPAFYLGSVPLPNGIVRHHTMGFGQDESNFNESTVIWYHVRKVEPAPAPHPTIEERLERIEAAIAKLQKP
jgi:Zn-dependent protease with chaperone function